VAVEDQQIRIRGSRKGLERVVIASSAGAGANVSSSAWESRTGHENDRHSDHWEISVQLRRRGPVCFR